MNEQKDSAASEGIPEPERDPSAAFAKWFKSEDFGDEEQLQRAFFAGVAFLAGIAAVDPRLVSPSPDEAAVRRAVEKIVSAIPDYYVVVLRATSAEPKFRNRVAEIISTELASDSGKVEK